MGKENLCMESLTTSAPSSSLETPVRFHKLNNKTIVIKCLTREIKKGVSVR